VERRAGTGQLIGRVERPASLLEFLSMEKLNEMIYESRDIYVNIRTLNRM